jgi:hypothetical protein
MCRFVRTRENTLIEGLFESIPRRSSEGFIGIAANGQFGAGDMGSESKLREGPYAIPVDVDFVPVQTVAGRDGVRMMVIVPALAKSERCHPPTVS